MKPLRMTILVQTLHQVDAVAKKTHLPATTVAEFIMQTFGFFTAGARQRNDAAKNLSLSGADIPFQIL